MDCRKYLFLLYFLGYAMFVAIWPSTGFSASCNNAPATLEPRIVLGLYDGRRELSPAQTRLHRFIELPLNHLGYVLRYLDVSRIGLPVVVDPEIAGVVTWFDAPLPDPEAFAKWAVGAGLDCPETLSFVVLGQTGLFPDRKPVTDEKAYLRRIGLGWTEKTKLLGDFTTVDSSDPKLLAFETDFVFQPGRYAALRALTAADAALTVVPSGKLAGNSIDLVVLHHPNAYVHESATVEADVRAAAYFWIMDPLTLLGRALSRNRRFPAADVTTLNGRRIYFEVVGPEGWLAPAPARNFDEEPRLGSENLLATLINPFPDLPVTVAVVTGDLDPRIGGKSAERGLRMARRIFDLPHTAVATSGRSLVRRWFGVSQPKHATSATEPNGGTASLDQSNRLFAVLGRNLREAFADPDAPAEPQLSDQARQYGQDTFSLRAETADAVTAVRALITNRQSDTPLFVWSGDGKPDQEARAAISGAKSPALGGGATALGAYYSLSGLSSFALSDGPDLQVYHAQPGDLGNLGYPSEDNRALQGLGGQILRSDHPFRLKPFQLAYSAGSANQFVTRSVIERLKHMAIAAKTIPIFASRYVGIVEGFYTVRFQPESALKWRVSKRGSLQTIRFDQAQALSLNMAESDGVLGARRINGGLYVALDPGAIAPLVALAPQGSPSGMMVPRGRIGISDSNLDVVSATTSPCLSKFEVTGWGQGEIGIYGDPGARYFVSVKAGRLNATGKVIAETQVLADASGFALVLVPTRAGSIETITLRQLCAG